MSAHPSAVADVLVIGAGPAGCATALQVARSGRRVVVVERDATPARRRPVLLTPRAVAELHALGLGDALTSAHRVDRLRLSAAGSSTLSAWPRHPRLPTNGAVARRETLDATLRDAATAAGVTILTAHDALAPIVDRGFVRGAHLRDPEGRRFEARAAYTVVADGANSQFGRALGTYREPSWPYALAHQGEFESPLAGVGEIELVLDLRDRAGTPITGFGWLFPTGRHTVGVGVLMMSTSPSFQVINPAHLFERFAAEQAEGWQLADAPTGDPSGGRITMGTSVGPAAGPTYLLVGDAVGAANPVSGAGFEGALETGRMAAAVLNRALDSGSSAALQQYPKQLADRFGTYYHVGRLATRLFGRPAIATRLATFVGRRPDAAAGFVRIATDSLRPGRGGVPELVFAAARAVTKVAPDA